MLLQVHNTQLSSAVNISDVISSARVFEKNGYIHIDYRTTPNYNNARKRFSTAEKSTKRGLARYKREAYQLALNHFLQSYIKPEQVLYFKDIAPQALDEDKANRQADVQNDYISIYTKFIKPYFKDMVLEDIKVKDIKEWKNKILTTQTISQSRYNKYHRVLNFIFKYAFENEYIEKNLMLLVDRKSKLFAPSTNRDSKYYTTAEAAAIMKHASGWFKVFMTTLFNSGLRTGEALALKWSDIEFEKDYITIQRSIRKGIIKNTTKTGVSRKIDLNKPLKTLLLEYQSTQAVSSIWLFPNPNTGNPYTEPKSIIRYKLKPLLKKLDIPYRTLYATRHTFATSAVENNIPLTYIQRQLGHQKLSTTTDYYIKNGLLGDDGRNTAADRLYVS